jgi:hypothetical protein
MRKLFAIAALGLAAFASLGFQQAGQPEARPRSGMRFEAVDVFVDSGAAGLGAYQVEVKAEDAAGAAFKTRVTLVGVEGGVHAAYKDAPHYDPAALHEDQLQDRIILAAFNTGADLPTGRTRVARIHVQVEGPEPVFKVEMKTAATADGTKIDATATAGAAGDAK